MAGGVFISYRRSDSAAFAGRIADFFAYNYPDIHVFFDIIGIAPGENFSDVIQSRLASSEVVLAVIGRDWLTAADDSGRRRLDNPQDFVRLELSLALQLGARVVPVLLDNAEMPSPEDLPQDLQSLAYCNAEFMRGAAFQRDMQHLADFVASYVASSDKQVTEAASEPKTEPGSPVYESLIADLEQFCFRSAEDSFIVSESDSGKFVQFAKISPDTVMMDLPSQVFTTQAQKQAAAQFFSETYVAHTVDLGDDMFTYQVEFPAAPEFLAHVTLDVFERLFGEIPVAPLSSRIDA